MTADRAIKEPVRAATTANITLSGPQTIDGVAVVAGDRVLVKNQTTATQNGIYDAASGAWARSSDFDGAGEVVGGTEVLVTSGTTQAGNFYRVAGAGAITPGTSAIDFELAITVLQAGTGAVVRSAEAKLREQWVSVKDFGATGDNATDDAPAINLAIAALSPGKTLYFPAGTYRVSVTSGGKALTPIPIGCNVFMEGGALLKPVDSAVTITIFTPLGDNILQVNIDGGKYPGSGGVRGVWNNHVTGIRCYLDAESGLGADRVTVINSTMKNFLTGIRSDGGKNWLVTQCRFTGGEQSAVQFAYLEGYDSQYNIVTDCTFEDLGDTAVSFFQVGVNLGYCRFNTVANCTAKNTNQGSAALVNGEGAGWAFDVEAGNPAYQQYISFVNLVVEQEAISGATLQRGATTMGGVRNGLVVGINAKSYSKAAEDVAINMTNCVGGLVDDYVVEAFGGPAINTDGSDGLVVGGNGTIINCGGRAGNTPAIRGSLEFATRNVIINVPKIIYEPTYPYRAGEAAVAFLANTAAAVPVNCEIVGGGVDNPMDYGAAIFGHKHHLTNVITPGRNCRISNFYARASGNAYLIHAAVIVRYMTNVEIRDIRIDPPVRTLGPLAPLYAAVDVRDCTNVLVDGIHVLGGTVTHLFDFTGSTEVRVDNQRTAPGATVSNHIVAGGNGTLTRWGEHVDAYPLANAANDAAAAALSPPVPVGAPYRNGSVRMVRVS